MVWLIEKISLFFNGNAAKISLFHVQIAILRLYFAEYLFCDKSEIYFQSRGIDFCELSAVHTFRQHSDLLGPARPRTVTGSYPGAVLPCVCYSLFCDKSI